MVTFRRFAGAVALALAVALAAGACSGGGDGDTVAKDPAAALSDAAERTAEAESVKMDLTITSSDGGKIGSGEGAYDFEKQLGRFSLTMSLLSVDLVVTPDDVYVKNPQPGPGDKPWVRAPEDGPAAGFLGQLRSQVDPRDALRNIGTSIKNAKKVSTAKVRGVDTTHLRGRVDLSDETIAKAPEEMKAGLRAAQEQFGAEGYPVDVWLDKEGRVRRFEYAMALPIGGGGSTTITMDLFGYGEDPKIVVPTPDEVQESAS